MILINKEQFICQTFIHQSTKLPCLVHYQSLNYPNEIPDTHSVICGFHPMDEERYFPADLTPIETSQGIVCVWYKPQLDETTNNLARELNKCVKPSYLCQNVFGWYFSDKLENCVFWRKQSNYEYTLEDENQKIYLSKI